MPRSSKQGNDIAVQGTNDSSIVSKTSMALQGYFLDEFLKMFVSKTSRRAPLINRGYYIRARAIDDIIKEFLSCFQDEKKQIISLGAGFDSAFFRLKANGHLNQTAFFEVDFADVVQRKAAIIKNKPLLRQVVGDIYDFPGADKDVYLISAQYHLLAVDLNNLQVLEQCLTEAGINFHRPTLLLSECVLTYMEVKSSNAVIEWAASSFPNAVFITYEQICPDDAFGMIMQKHFQKLNSPLKAIQTYTTEKLHRQRFQSLGWLGTSAIDMNSYYCGRVPFKERQRVESLEPFDEFEEWHLKCSHYAVIAGYNGSCYRIKTCFIEDEHRFPIKDGPLDEFSLPPLQAWPLVPSNCRHPVRRFGHASALASPNKVIITGGFGEAGNKHMRLGDMIIVDFKSKKWTTITAGEGVEELAPRMFHTLTPISGGNRWFLFGGRSSPTDPFNSTFVLSLHEGSRALQCSSDQSIVGEIPSNYIQNSDTSSFLKSVQNSESTMRNVEINGDAAMRFVEENKRCVKMADHPSDLEMSFSTGRCASKDCETLDCFKLRETADDSFSSIKPNKLLLFSEMNYGTLVLSTAEDLRSKTRSKDNDNRDLKKCEETGLDEAKMYKTSQSENLKDNNEDSLMDSIQPSTTQAGRSFYSCTNVQSPSNLTPRWRHSAVQAFVSAEECVVMYGGRGVGDTVFADCWSCGVTKLEWKQLFLAGNRPPPSHSHSACVWQDTRMILAGGLGPNLQLLNSVYIVDLETLRCHEMDLRPTLQPRYSHTAHVIGDSLLLVGGVNPLGANVYTVAFIDLKSGTWCMYSLQTCDIEHPLMVHNHSSELLSEMRLAIIGGGGNCFSFGTHLNRSPLEIHFPHQDDTH